MTDLTSSNFENLASGAGKQTLIKTTLRNQIDLVSITDQKANMLLSINAIILSIVLTLSSARLLIDISEKISSTPITIPIIGLLLTCLFSGILCIYAAKPPRNSNKNKAGDIGILMLTVKDKLKNENAFLEEMENILSSNDLIYRNMILDIHKLGLLLTRKYKLLRFAYYFFFIGITVSVLAFIVLLF